MAIWAAFHVAPQMCCSNYFQYTQFCSSTVAVVASQQTAGTAVSTRHHLIRVMSERRGGDRGAFVALLVPTSETLVSSGQKYFSLNLKTHNFGWMMLLSECGLYGHEWWGVLCCLMCCCKTMRVCKVSTCIDKWQISGRQVPSFVINRVLLAQQFKACFCLCTPDCSHPWTEKNNEGHKIQHS